LEVLLDPHEGLGVGVYMEDCNTLGLAHEYCIDNEAAIVKYIA
jgi:hypothetical protein